MQTGNLEKYPVLCLTRLENWYLISIRSITAWVNSFGTGQTGCVLCCVKDEKGIEHRTDLPAVKSEGISLRVLTTDQKLIFSVSKPSESAANQQVIAIAHMNQQIVYKAIVNLKDVAMNGGNIPTGQLPTGILQLTIFDLNQIPLAERVCFINNHNYSSDASLTLSAKSLKKRGRNVLDSTAEYDTSQSNLSLSITDAEVDGNKSLDDNIISCLLLTGDLHGFVKNPYYYFQNRSDSLVQQLDLVMLTHGWRRFKWEDLAKKKVPVIKFPIENYLSLNAEVLGVQSSHIAKDESLNVIFQTGLSTTCHVLRNNLKPCNRFVTLTQQRYYQFNLNHNLSRVCSHFKNGLDIFKESKTLIGSLVTRRQFIDSKKSQVYTEIIRIQDQNRKVQNLGAVTVRGRVKSDKEKLTNCKFRLVQRRERNYF
jgi:hypothetical protein